MLFARRQSVPGADFPYCRCVDYSDSSSPFVLALQGAQLNPATGSTPRNYTVTFEVVDRVTPPNPSECYERILKDGAPKVEIMTSESDPLDLLLLPGQKKVSPRAPPGPYGSEDLQPGWEQRNSGRPGVSLEAGATKGLGAQRPPLVRLYARAPRTPHFFAQAERGAGRTTHIAQGSQPAPNWPFPCLYLALRPASWGPGTEKAKSAWLAKE